MLLLTPGALTSTPFLVTLTLAPGGALTTICLWLWPPPVQWTAAGQHAEVSAHSPKSEVQGEKVEQTQGPGRGFRGS